MQGKIIEKKGGEVFTPILTFLKYSFVSFSPSYNMIIRANDCRFDLLYYIYDNNDNVEERNDATMMTISKERAHTIIYVHMML